MKHIILIFDNVCLYILVIYQQFYKIISVILIIIIIEQNYILCIIMWVYNQYIFIYLSFNSNNFKFVLFSTMVVLK